MRKWAVLGLFALAGCNDPEASAKDAAASLLRDPASAQFRNVRTTPDGVVCGEINGRNGFGAYAGFTRFVVPKGGDAVLEPTGDGPDEALAAQYFEVLWVGCGP